MLVHVQCALVHVTTSNSDFEHGDVVFRLKKIIYQLNWVWWPVSTLRTPFFLAWEAQEFSSFHNIHRWCVYSNIYGTLVSLSVFSEGVYLVLVFTILHSRRIFIQSGHLKITQFTAVEMLANHSGGHQHTTTTSQLTHQFCAPSLGGREDSNVSQ